MQVVSEQFGDLGDGNQLPPCTVHMIVQKEGILLRRSDEQFISSQAQISQPTRNTKSNATIQDNQILPGAHQEAKASAAFDGETPPSASVVIGSNNDNNDDKHDSSIVLQSASD